MSGSTVAPSSPTTSEFLDLPKSKEEAGSSAISLTTSYGDRLEDALRPDPGSEDDFQVENNSFAFSPGQLNKLLNPKSLPAFVALGGLHGLEYGLRTNATSGLSLDETRLEGRVSFDEATRYDNKVKSYLTDIPINAQREGTQTAAAQSSEAFADRIRVYSCNVLPEKRATPIWELAWNAYKGDKILLLLTVAAIISLALGLYETFGVDHLPGEPMPVDWVEGLAICIAIIIVVSDIFFFFFFPYDSPNHSNAQLQILVGSLNDWQKERAFVKLNAKKEDRKVQVIRSGKEMMIDVHDVLVGDVLNMQAGDMIPADGIFITGQNVKCDESSATGESDQIKKRPAQQVMQMWEQGQNDIKNMDPFVVSGSKVLEGVGSYLVTSVGVNSSYGKILMAMRQEMEATPLQVKLDGLATAIAKLGSLAAGLLFFVLLFRFIGHLPANQATPEQKASQFLDILIVAVTVIVVAVPEGLPLAVTLALAFATTRMAKQNNLVRILKSCETMGNATTVCSDKTGTLTQNKMTVVTGTFGELSFDDKNQTGDEIRSTTFARDVSAENKRIMIESIAINSTAFETTDNSTETFVGSKTETALLGFARNVLGMGPLSQERSNANIVQIMPFDSGRKCSGVVIKLTNGVYRFLVKGASEILLSYASEVASSAGYIPLGKEEHTHIESVIDSYAKQSLRTISLVYRDFAQWPPVEAQSSSDPSTAELDRLLYNMKFIGVVGIQDPVRPGVPQAVAKCKHAGVKVRMVTGDNMTTAKAIATECGIYNEGGLVMEGPVFRTLSDEKMKEILPELDVLARSSPEDKRILVTKLREMGDIVAVTGDGKFTSYSSIFELF
jgi:P-type Ca2+ transporter type 2C